MSIKVMEVDNKKINKPLRAKKVLKRIAIGVGIFLVFLLAIAAILFPRAKALADQVNKTAAQFENVKKAADSENIIAAKEELIKLEEEVKKTQEKYRSFRFAKRIPFVSLYYKDGEHTLNVAVDASEAAVIGSDAVIPFADILGLKGEKSQLNAEAKAQAIVKKVIPNILPITRQIEEKINNINNELSQVNPDRYPKGLKIRGFVVRDSLIKAKEVATNTSSAFPKIKLVLEILPQIAGEPINRTYLIMLQNDKELRATGGFITSYAIARVSGGRILSVKSESTEALDKKFVNKPPAPDVYQKYLKISTYNIRDSNLSPDFLVSARKFEEFYKQIPGSVSAQGVFALDTEFVRSLMEVTGPIYLSKYNETFSPKVNEKYGVSDVVYKLELYTEKILRGNRKGIIGDLMQELLIKVLSSPPKKFPQLLDTFINAANEKHILFYFHDPTEQKVMEELGWAGRVKEYDADYLYVNDSNFAGRKANLYVIQKVQQDIEVKDSEDVIKTVKVTFTNPKPGDGWLNSIYLHWTRFYAPRGSTLISSEIERDFSEGDELGKKVFRGYSATYPLDSNTLTVTYKLPFKVKKGEEYRLLVQKQPGTGDFEYIISLNGKEIEKFNLKADKEIKFRI